MVLPFVRSGRKRSSFGIQGFFRLFALKDQG